MSLNAFHGICFILFFNLTYAAYFTSLDEVGYLLPTREQVINDLYLYIDNEKKIISILRRYLELFKKEQNMISKNVANYLGNPLNAFVLIKRLTVDLERVKEIINTRTESNLTMEHEFMLFPNQTDLVGAVKGFMAIQETYNLDVKDIAEGNLNGFATGMPMTASDCYELGRLLFNELDPALATEWMEAALRKYHEEAFPYLFTDVDIMEFISYGHSMLGEPKIALQWTRKILKINANHSRARRSVTRYKKEIVELEMELKEANDNKEKTYVENEPNREDFGVETDIPDDESIYNHDHPETYHSLCRGDIGVPVEISSRLTCRYLSENHPFLKIAPMKMEMIYLNPDMILFHNVLSNAEIAKILKFAKPRLHRSVIQDSKTGDPVPTEDRVSKSATVMDVYSDILRRVSERAMQMTGLNMECTKRTQIANYGIGGYYLPHLDFLKVDNDTYATGGRRIATLLFYLSDVPQGGATVFTKVGVSIPPVKGTAVFWYNLHSSGEANHALVHGGCPVLRGSKWVATKWILQGGQEFLKPCSLRYQPEGWDDKIPSLVHKAIRDKRLFGKK